MGKAKNYFKQVFKKIEIHTIRTKLIISFLLIGLVPLIIFALFSYKTYFGVITERTSAYSQEVVSRMKRDIDSYFSDIEKFLTREQDFYINQFIKLTQIHDFANNRKYTFRIWEDFNNLRYMKPGLEDIALTFSNGKRISCYGLYYIDIEAINYALADGLKESGIAITSPHTNFSRKDVVSILRPYYPDDAEARVLISADINIDMLADITNVKLGEKGYVFIADGDGNIIYHPDRDLIGQKSSFYKLNKSGKYSYIADDNKYILNTAKSLVTGWNIVSVAYASEVEAELNQLKKITILISGLILFVIILLTMYLSYALSHPIRELEEVTQQAANNDLSVKIETQSKDEIAQLGKSFNKMISKIKKLMEENIAEQKLLRELEMESLDNQIKPHFIYNTLDLIIGQLENNNSNKATRLIEALGNFFRLSLSHGKEMVKIVSEVEHVKNYLYIQKLRQGEKYEYIIDIKDLEIRNKYIPRLLLQPLVENAIYHGILKSDKKGLIIVKGYLEGDTIYFEVIDNGMGMEDSKIKEINQILQGLKEPINEKQYFGLRNVNQRIKLKFGEGYGLFVSGEIGVKTRMIIKLPYRQQGGYDV
ncbi:sensor histidine kinase [Halocella sp. SP3-1]|uniref:sensor histidine kinase n=1 Tax=Halocella sp. SP3-1 TaxID=2382161 RepID=UPI000F758BD7|nr:sensor histidine kinase [Halocella sp. SP3-1]AZO96494.1 sensor histidine kinase [Halocella sp. SP3-1]